jgi:hypothetical protein
VPTAPITPRVAIARRGEKKECDRPDAMVQPGRGIAIMTVRRGAKAPTVPIAPRVATARRARQVLSARARKGATPATRLALPGKGMRGQASSPEAPGRSDPAQKASGPAGTASARDGLIEKAANDLAETDPVPPGGAGRLPQGRRASLDPSLDSYEGDRNAA